MWLFTFDWAETWWDNYLWRNIQKRLKSLREEKLQIVKKQLWIETISRPSIETCDVSDTSSILWFLARENLDCAFNCDPDTQALRVQELCDIITGNIPNGKHIHIIPHENTETAARDKSWSGMFWYFEVWIRDTPQNQSHKISALSRFKSFFLQALWSSHLLSNISEIHHS